MARSGAETGGACTGETVARVPELPFSEPPLGPRSLRHPQRTWIQGLPGPICPYGGRAVGHFTRGGVGCELERGDGLVGTLRRLGVVQTGISQAGDDAECDEGLSICHC